MRNRSSLSATETLAALWRPGRHWLALALAVLVAGPAMAQPPVLELALPELGGPPRLTVHGQVGATIQIESVEALGDPNQWQLLTDLGMPSSPQVFDDTISPPGAQRYYRAVVLGGGPPPPPQPGMVRIRPGTFTMGSPPTEQGRKDDEGPQTVVTLTRGFSLGEHEVTQREYQAVMGSNPSYFTGDLDRPVEQVSWNEAVAYCAALTAQERGAGRLPAGWEYRLPTEAEWEYAARAGTTNRFSYGDDPGYSQLGSYAWYLENSYSTTRPAGAFWDPGNHWYYTTHAVGQKEANPWGLYDMAGNVTEWCADWYAANYSGGRVTDPAGPGSGLGRVIRGGSWVTVGYGCRSAFRLQAAPTGPFSRGDNLGFRVALGAVP